ncbi:hypothetical protein ACLK2H_23830 [Escherichia coli]
MPTTTSNSWRWSVRASALPDILNYDQVVKVTGSFKTPMGCRSFLACGKTKMASRYTMGVTTWRYQPEPAAHRAGSQR